MPVLVIILMILILIAVWCVVTVNDFKKKEIRTEEGLSGIEVALAKRRDLLTKLIDTTKSYAEHESKLFTKVIELRRGMSITELNGATEQMDSLDKKLFAVAESYPELRSSEVYVELQRGIRDAEEQLQAARRLYNTSVRAYNTAIEMFPAKLLAGSRRPKEFFTADESKRGDVDTRI